MKQQMNKTNRLQQLAGIDETKVGPKLTSITLKGTTDTNITFHIEDFETDDEFREFCDKLKTDEDFKYDVFFDNKNSSNLSWEVNIEHK